MGVIKGDTRSLDYSSCIAEHKKACRYHVNFQARTNDVLSL